MVLGSDFFSGRANIIDSATGAMLDGYFHVAAAEEHF